MATQGDATPGILRTKWAGTKFLSMLSVADPILFLNEYINIIRIIPSPTASFPCPPGIPRTLRSPGPWCTPSAGWRCSCGTRGTTSRASTPTIFPVLGALATSFRKYCAPCVLGSSPRGLARERYSRCPFSASSSIFEASPAPYSLNHLSCTHAAVQANLKRASALPSSSMLQTSASTAFGKN